MKLLSLLSIATVAVGLATGAETMMVKRVLDVNRYPNAVCLDGTPGAYYFHKSPTGSTTWQLYFEGGGWCYNELDCAERAKTDLGSSKNYPALKSRSDVNGLLSSNCDTNPEFCDANLVFMKYCDGDSFSGARDDAVEVNGQALHFKGKYILEAILLSLQGEGLTSATSVLQTGCSAGGLSSYLHGDYVGSFVSDVAPALTRFAVAPISGYFLTRNNVDDKDIYGAQIKYISGLANATSGLPPSCVSSSPPGESWRCNTAEGAYRSMESPVFVLDSSIDSWQSGCILGATEVPPNSSDNGYCNRVPGFESCSGDPRTCTDSQIYSITEYQGSFVRSLTRSDTYGLDGNGAFVYECFTHCAAQDDWAFLGFTLGGVTLRDAVYGWWRGLEGGKRPPATNFLPQLWNTDSTNPNPTC